MREGLLERVREKKPLDYLAYLLLRPLVCAVSLLPPRWSLRTGSLLGRVAFYLDRKHREICLTNLAIAFPAMRPAARWDLGLRAFVHVGMTFAELPSLGRRRLAEILERVEYRGYEHYAEAERKGKGLLLLTGHLGNWEWMALAHGYVEGHRLAVVARALDNPYLERWLAGVRRRSGNQVIHKRGALRRVVRSLREGRAVGLLMDQKSIGPDGVLVDFFGKPAFSSSALALVAMRSGAPVIPVHARRKPGGLHHTIHMGPEVPVLNTGRKRPDLVANTRRFQKVLEGMIESQPEQWFWMHRRWKDTPYVEYPAERRQRRRAARRARSRGRR